MLYDITLPLSPDTICFPGDRPPRLTRLTDVAWGDEWTASELRIGCHVGTHIDTPSHFLEHGMTLDKLPADTFYGPAELVDCRNSAIITEHHLRSSLIPLGSHILLKTDNSSLLHQTAFCEKYTVLSPEGARYLITLNPLSVGFDYYSLDPWEPEQGSVVHTILAIAGISVFVCLDLLNVPKGPYVFAGFPLALKGAEGSPVRAMLIGP